MNDEEVEPVVNIRPGLRHTSLPSFPVGRTSQQPQVYSQHPASLPVFPGRTDVAPQRPHPFLPPGVHPASLPFHPLFNPQGRTDLPPAAPHPLLLPQLAMLLQALQAQGPPRY